MNPTIASILDIFVKRGDEIYGVEEVTQRQHALQCATLAEKEGVSGKLISAALLHDIGHLISDEDLPENLQKDLHDYHEEVGYHWLLEHFGSEVANPVGLHVEAKRYLCTTDPEYSQRLSPTSYKSYLDQGGPMNEEEKADFEGKVHFEEAVRLRIWDDKAKDPKLVTPGIHHFIPYIEEALTKSSS